MINGESGGIDILQEMTRMSVEKAVFFGCCVTYGLKSTSSDKSWPFLVSSYFGFECDNQGIGATVIQSTQQNQVAVIRDSVKDNAVDSFYTRVRLRAPSYLFIQYGLNDLRLNDPNFTLKTFMQSVVNLLRMSIATLPKEHIVMASPQYIPESTYALYPPWNAGSLEKHLVYTEAMAFLAKEYQVSFVDSYNEMHKYPDSEIISDDGFHPNDRGHEVIAESFIRAFKNSGAKS